MFAEEQLQKAWRFDDAVLAKHHLCWINFFKRITGASTIASFPLLCHEVVYATFESDWIGRDRSCQIKQNPVASGPEERGIPTVDNHCSYYPNRGHWEHAHKGPWNALQQN